VTVTAADPAVIAIQLHPWIRMRDRGWYSGDMHVHRAPEDMPALTLAEDLNISVDFTMWNKQDLWEDKALRYSSRAMSDWPAPHQRRSSESPSFCRSSRSRSSMYASIQASASSRGRLSIHPLMRSSIFCLIAAHSSCVRCPRHIAASSSCVKCPRPCSGSSSIGAFVGGLLGGELGIAAATGGEPGGAGARGHARGGRGADSRYYGNVPILGQPGHPAAANHSAAGYRSHSGSRAAVGVDNIESDTPACEPPNCGAASVGVTGIKFRPQARSPPQPAGRARGHSGMTPNTIATGKTDAMTAGGQMTERGHNEELPPVTFRIDIPVMAVRVAGSNPSRTGARRHFPPTRLPSVGVAIPAVISPNPDVIPAWTKGTVLPNANRRPKPDNDLRMSRDQP